MCAGIKITGASVVVPNSLHALLADRIANLPSHMLGSFISYRSNKSFTERLLELRPDIWNRLQYFGFPLKEDSDVDILVALYEQGLLPEELRVKFVKRLRESVIEYADDSFLDSDAIGAILTESERQEILHDVKVEVLEKLALHIERVCQNWQSDYDPDDHFEPFRSAIHTFADALDGQINSEIITISAEASIHNAIANLESEYQHPPSISAPIQQSVAKADSLSELFRDVDE